MAGLSDLLGRNGVLEQLLLWGVVNQVIQSMAQPAFTALLQDSQAAHPEQALDPVTVADLLARHMMTDAEATAEAAKSGMNDQRFDQLAELHKVRLSPADLATAVLRSYVTLAHAEAESLPQGIDAQQLAVLTDLAGDAPGPQQLAEALRRGLIPEHGRGPKERSYDQGIAESRLHDKWGQVLRELSHVLLSPPDAASAVVRNFIDAESAQDLADQQGVDGQTFAIMTHLAADAPGPQQLAEALRRGLIKEHGKGAGATSFEQGIAEGRLADKWAKVIQGLSKLWPTPVDALEAALKGQVTDEQGQDLYQQLGGDMQFYRWLLDSQGDAPSPLEAASMAARGIIPWHGRGPNELSFDQAIREGRTRNKWTNAIRDLTRYLPAPGEITTFLAHTAIDKARATELLTMHDMDDDVLAAYLNEAELTALSDYRGLTQSAVVDMYYAHLIDADQATAILEVLHVSPAAANLLLRYADLRQVIDSIQKSVQRIAQLFTGRKIGAETAKVALLDLKIPVGTVDQILVTWQLQAEANVKILTETQIIDAFYYQVFTLAEAIEELRAIGYTPYDAWVLLSLKLKTPLPGKPQRDVAPPAGAVIPGVT